MVSVICIKKEKRSHKRVYYNKTQPQNADAEGSGIKKMEVSRCESDGPIVIDRDFLKENANRNFVHSQEHLLIILCENMYNWFSFIAELKIIFSDLTQEDLEQMLHAFVHCLLDADLSTEETTLWQQSRQAYLTTRSQTISEEQHRVGGVWTDSESDDPEDWVELTRRGSLQSKAFQEKI